MAIRDPSGVEMIVRDSLRRKDAHCVSSGSFVEYIFSNHSFTNFVGISTEKETRAVSPTLSY